MFSIGFNRVVDCLLPQCCCLCGMYAPLALCQTCLTSIADAPTRVILDNDVPCLSFVSYESEVMTMLHSIKFSRLKSVAEVLGNWIADRMIPSDVESVDVAISIPLHPKKLRQRGFNQTDLLFRTLLKNSGIVLYPALIRTKNTRPLFELESDERRQELRGAFDVDSNFLDECKNGHVLLLDDISTSGATFNEAIRVLSPIARKITCLAFAQTPLKSGNGEIEN